MIFNKFNSLHQQLISSLTYFSVGYLTNVSVISSPSSLPSSFPLLLLLFLLLFQILVLQLDSTLHIRSIFRLASTPPPPLAVRPSLNANFCFQSSGDLPRFVYPSRRISSFAVALTENSLRDILKNRSDCGLRGVRTPPQKNKKNLLLFWLKPPNFCIGESRDLRPIVSFDMTSPFPFPFVPLLSPLMCLPHSLSLSLYCFLSLSPPSCIASRQRACVEAGCRA